MPTGTFTAVLHKEGDLYVASCPEVGTVSQGKTVEEAIANLKEATELYMEEFPPEGSSPHWLPSSRHVMPRLPAYQGRKRSVLLNDWASLRFGNANLQPALCTES
jgi:predicted RNase H-like HicB family nuclease